MAEVIELICYIVNKDPICVLDHFNWIDLYPYIQKLDLHIG